MQTDNLPQFFTATCKDWKRLLEPDKYKNIIMESLKYLVNEKKIVLNAFVIMDNHIHLIWQLGMGLKQDDIQKSFLKFTADAFKKDLKINHPAILEEYLVNKKDRKYQFWKRDSLSIELRTKTVFEQKISYIHENPTKAGLCLLPEDYYYSSAKFYKTGIDSFCCLTHWDE